MTSVQTSIFLIEEMDCSAEEQLIRGRLSNIPEVGEMEFNIPARTLKVEHRLADESRIISAVASIGMTAVPENPERLRQQLRVIRPSFWRSTEFLIIAASGISALSAEVLGWTGMEGSLPLRILASVAILTGAYKTFGKAWYALRSFTLTIHVLMLVAVGGAVALGDWSEAGMVMFLFAVAEVIESRSLEHARNSISSLVKLSPETATVLHADHWHDIPVERIKSGDVVRVKSGERLSVDGIVRHGSSDVDQSPITGESVPVSKIAGDAVFAGSVNRTGTFDYRATSVAADSAIERIMRTVQMATANRTDAERFIDRFARYYTPVVVGIAAGMAVVPPLLFGGAWSAWTYNALVMLVISCPCSLVISTPVSVVSGLANAARRGILVKGGSYLELGARLKMIAFDKTGTLTEGRPAITDVITYDGISEERVLHLAAAVERASEHPVATAIVAAHRRMHGVHDDAAVTDFLSITGQGATAVVDGRKIIVGNHRLAHETGVCSESLEWRLDDLEKEGKTAIVVMTEQSVLGVIALADTVRQSSARAIAELHGLGLSTMMLTGDNATVARGIAQPLGIDDVRADLLPEGKIMALTEARLLCQGAVGMIGDGINDAPALAGADIGFAMSVAGTGIAIEAARVAIMSDNLMKLPEFIRLSRRTVSVLKQNVALALGIKLVFAVLAVLGYSALWMAIFADMGASLIVVFNGLRLLRGTESR